MEEVTAMPTAARGRASFATESLAVEPQTEAAADEMTPTGTIAAHTTAPQNTPATTEEPTMNKPAQKRQTTRPNLYVDDLNEMTALMNQRGITGGMADVFHALLVAFQQQESTQQQTESLGEMGKALNRFLDRIQALEATVSQLEDERDRLRAGQEQLGELERLQTENQQLRSQLEQVQAELANPRKMLERVLAQSATQSVTATAPTTTEPVQTIAPSSLRSNIEPSNVVPAAKTAQRPAKEARSSEPKSRNLDETKLKIGQIIDAMISWNSSQPTSSTMLAISIPAIKGIAGVMGAAYQKAIQEVLAEREDELKDLGDHWMLGSRHNAIVRGKDDVLRSIARQNLGLDNWQQVKFG